MTTATQVDEYQLDALLDALKMDALKNIRRNLNLKNMSSLRKKNLFKHLRNTFLHRCLKEQK